MRRFIESCWLPIVTVLLLAGGTTLAYALLRPTGFDIGNAEILKYARIGGWGIGLATGILSLIFVGILHLIRRLIGLRKTFVLHAPVVLLSVLPWLIFSWNVLGEPRYTPIARAIIDFAARPMLWGSLIASLFVIFVSLIAFFLPKKT